MSDSIKILKDNFKNIGGFIEANNYKLIDVKEDYALMEAKLGDNSMNPYGIAHGGYLFGLVDTCAGVAASTNGLQALTLNSNINYLNACKSDLIKAEAKAIKSGKHIKVYEVNIFDGDKIICNGTVSYYVMDIKLEK